MKFSGTHNTKTRPSAPVESASTFRGEWHATAHRSIHIYTERQKKLITSSELYSLNPQSIKITHNWAQISYDTSYQGYLKKKKVWLRKNGVKCSEIARGQFSKITQTVRLSGSEFGTDNLSQNGSYIINNPLLKLNE